MTPTIPVVLYPAIYLSERKQPQVFLDVVERLARRTPLRVEARLHESHLASEAAMRLSLRGWAWVGPLTATREDYWAALARTTAFLATATDESYGLEYIEALVAGAVGVLPDRPWARAILPPATRSCTARPPRPRRCSCGQSPSRTHAVGRPMRPRAELRAVAARAAQRRPVRRGHRRAGRALVRRVGPAPDRRRVGAGRTAQRCPPVSVLPRRGE